MRRPALNRSILSGVLLALVAALLLTASLAGAEGTKTVAKAGGNPAADDAYLTNLKGRTLYTLSNERGKFVCKAACLQSWPPLTIPAGTKPIGPVKLGMVKRPDGRWQVTRKGLPLYTYAGDTKKGDTNGEGLKTGGGTWHVSRLDTQVAQPPPPPPQPPNPYGY
jgi:predicted lipoprotein with Yx(FWY)xxD motif